MGGCKANDDGHFISIPGLEWTKKQGHTCIYDPKTRRWPNDTRAFYEAAAKAGVVVKFNHPGEGTEVFDGLAYSEVGNQAVQLMEVRRYKEERAFLRALNQGWHLAPDGADDTHSANWGNAGRWTGILAPGLSKRNVWDALKNRRCYSTLDRNCNMFFEENGAAMGTIMEKPVREVQIKVKVKDDDVQDAVASIELFEDGKIVQTHRAQSPNESEVTWTVTRGATPGKHYYFVKVAQADGNLLWSAPVSVTVAEN